MKLGMVCPLDGGTFGIPTHISLAAKSCIGVKSRPRSNRLQSSCLVDCLAAGILAALRRRLVDVVDELARGRAVVDRRLPLEVVRRVARRSADRSRDARRRTLEACEARRRDVVHDDEP